MFHEDMCAFGPPVREFGTVWAATIAARDTYNRWKWQGHWYFTYEPGEAEGETPRRVKDILIDVAEQDYKTKVNVNVQQDTPELLAYDLVDQED